MVEREIEKAIEYVVYVYISPDVIAAITGVVGGL